MKKIKVLNFQNLTIQNVEIINNPMIQKSLKDKNSFKIVFVRNPYEYFSFLLTDYLLHQKSILFTQDINNKLNTMNSIDFLKWLETLNFIPFYNPQTFQLDHSVRISKAIKNLEKFDYVVPYEEIGEFLKNTSLNIIIEEKKEKLISPNLQNEHNSLKVFIDKDLKLYERSVELWNLSKKNNFKPLSLLIKHRELLENNEVKQKNMSIKNYKGSCDNMTSTSISGWVFHKTKQESLTVHIYKNNILLCKSKANILRKGLKAKNVHSTGECGFKIDFENPIFQPGDNIEVKLGVDGVSLPFTKRAKEFLSI